jgi:nicotinate-nucleotide--dimethylbenzimidazole phosphoribosyltransferase
MAGFQATDTPLARPCSVLLFASDHPVASQGVSPYPSSVTRAMVDNFVRGGAAASVLARLHGLPLHVFDVGVEGQSSVEESSAHASLHRLTPQVTAGDIACEPALSPEGFERCVSYGGQAIMAHCKNDRVVVFGEMGIGNTTPATAVGAALLGLRVPATLVGKGTGATGALLEMKKNVVSRAVARIDPGLPPREILRELGGREMVAIYGAMRAALGMRKVLIIDGFIVTAVALALAREEENALDGMIFAHESGEQGHHALLAAMGVRPLLRLGMRLGEATGALTAFPVIEAACRTHNEMATFESAAIPDKEEP